VLPSARPPISRRSRSCSGLPWLPFPSQCAQNRRWVGRLHHNQPPPQMWTTQIVPHRCLAGADRRRRWGLRRDPHRCRARGTDTPDHARAGTCSGSDAASLGYHRADPHAADLRSGACAEAIATGCRADAGASAVDPFPAALTTSPAPTPSPTRHMWVAQLIGESSETAALFRFRQMQRELRLRSAATNPPFFERRSRTAQSGFAFASNMTRARLPKPCAPS
jgi:hypothetical protein